MNESSPPTKRIQVKRKFGRKELLLLSGGSIGLISYFLPWLAYDSGATRSMYEYMILGSSYLLILAFLFAATLTRRPWAAYFLGVFGFVWPAGVLFAFVVNPSRLCMEFGCPSEIMAGVYVALCGGILTLAGGILAMISDLQGRDSPRD